MSLRHIAAVVIFALPAMAPAQEQRVQLTPVAEADALQEFGRVCFASFPNVSKVRRAIEHSAVPYTPAAGPSAQWRSNRSVVALVTDGGDAQRCDFDAVLTERIDAGATASRIHAWLRARLRVAPPLRQVGQTIVWEWADGFTQRTLTADFSTSGRQLALSLASRRGV